MTALPASLFPADRRFIAALYGLVLLSVAAFCQFREAATPLVLTAAAVLVACFLVDAPRGRPLPKIVINVVLVGVALNFWREASSSDNFNLMTSLGNFIVGLLICKCFERKNPRDVTQMLVLSLLIIVASTMYSSSLSFGIMLVGYFALLVYTVVLLHLRVQTHEVATTRRMPTHLLSAGQHRWFARDIRMTAFRAVLVLVPVAIVIFLMMPRSRGNSILNRWSAGATFQTGFSEEVRFQDYGQLNQSDAIAMEVWFYQNKVNVGAEIVDPYFRGLTLEVYNEHTGRWTHDYRNDIFEEMLPDPEGYTYLLPFDYQVQSPVLEQVYKVAASNREFVFHVTSPTSLSTARPRTYLFSRGSGVLRANERNGPANYTVESLARPDPALFGSTPPKRPPESDPPSDVIRQMAREIAGDLLPAVDGPMDTERTQLVAARFESYLRANYPYSLEFKRVDRAMEPITDFLKNHKELGGHCEYFAAAMVMLCRAVNIEARIVTGYHGGEFNTLSGSFTVLQRHAHAWAEYYVPTIGWTHSDPSPIALNTVYSASIWRRWLQEFNQIIQNTWISAVVTFDNESRQAVAAWFRHWLGAFQRSDIWRADMWTRLMFGVPLVGLAAVLYYIVRRLRRERAEQALLGPVRKHVRLSGDGLFLDELLRLITRRAGPALQENGRGARAGRRLDQTPREYVEAAAPVLGTAAEDARWLVNTFYGLQFGGTSVTPGLRKEIGQAMRRVREGLRAPEGTQAAQA